MKKGQTSKVNGVENFLCPFTDVFITQDRNVGTHKGTEAIDVRGKQSGVKYPYYAPCTCKLLWKDKSNGQGLWQSKSKVKFSNNRIDYATFMTAHDESFDARIGQVVKQGTQLGNMGSKHNGSTKSTGVHCHIEVAQGKYTINDWHKNKYGIWCFKKEYAPEKCFFMNNTNIIKGLNKKWKIVEVEKVKKEKVDQILHIGSKVKFNGTFIVDRIDVKNNTFCNYSLIGGKPTKAYHWLPSGPFDNVNGKKYIKPLDKVRNTHTYKVEKLDTKSDSAMLKIDGRICWIKCKYLKEV